MFNTSKVVTELKKVVGWRDFWDLTEIPALGSPLNDSESGQYFQEFSGALRLDYIQSLLAANRPLTTYLDTVEEEAIKQALNQIETYKQLKNVGRDIATNDVVYDIGRRRQNITNESRFVGVMFELKNTVGLAAILNRVGLYLTAPVTNLTLYLFHSTQEQVVSTYNFTTTKSNSFSWSELQIQLDYDIDTSGISAGTWYLGYYQDDLAAQSSQAVRYTNMNWANGYCYSCDNGVKQAKYNSIASRLYMMGFYVPSGNLPVDPNERFDNDHVVKTNSNNYGFNFNISIVCDLTQFWIDNRIMLVRIIGLTVAMKVLEMMKYSSQINNVEEAVKVMIVRDLEGANDTGLMPLWERQEKAIKSLVLDEGNLNVDCLPCARKPKTTYGAIG